MFFQSTFNDSKLKKFFLHSGLKTIRVEKNEKERERETESEKTEENVTLNQLKKESYNLNANEQQ